MNMVLLRLLSSWGCLAHATLSNVHDEPNVRVNDKDCDDSQKANRITIRTVIRATKTKMNGR